MRNNVTRTRASWALSLVVLSALGIAPVFAQSTAPTSAPAPVKRISHESAGIEVALAEPPSVNNNKAVLTLVVKNTTQVRQYLMVFGSQQATADGGLSADNMYVKGMPSCGQGAGTDAAAVQSCLNNTKDLNDYTYLEPGDLATVELEYLFGDNVASSNWVSFAFKAIVRSAKASSTSLGSSEDEGSVSPPRIIIVNFPLTPLKQAQ